MINVSTHLVRPVIFLAIDKLATEDYDQEGDIQDGQGGSKTRKTNAAIRQTGIYQAALKYAHQKHGCMNLFSAQNDKGIIKAGDVFTYAGRNSAQTGKTLQDMADIEILSGIEAIRRTEKSHKRVAD